jgi:heat-inducible transcriptional repressor
MRGVVELSRRDLAVLYEIVDLYIRTGAPIASRDVAHSSRLGLSPATIRNIMARLEEADLVERPHPSAGCCPTDISLRAYVERLEPQRRVPNRAQREVLQRVATVAREPEEDIGWVARLVAEVTREAGVAVRPMGEEPVLEAVSLVRLSGSRALAVVVTGEGSVSKRVVALDESFDRDELGSLSAELSRQLRGRSLSAIRELVQGEGETEEPSTEGTLSARVVEVARTLFGGDEGDSDVRVAGADALASSSDFAEVDRLRSLVNVLQDRARIAREWRRVLRGRRTRVIIGDESEVTASGGLGMVASLFYREGRRVGALGVVGPRRMDYGRIVPLVEFIADMVTRMLEEPGVKHA